MAVTFWRCCWDGYKLDLREEKSMGDKKWSLVESTICIIDTRMDESAKAIK